jgi:hypothetical protein
VRRIPETYKTNLSTPRNNCAVGLGLSACARGSKQTFQPPEITARLGWVCPHVRAVLCAGALAAPDLLLKHGKKTEISQFQADNSQF